MPNPWILPLVLVLLALAPASAQVAGEPEPAAPKPEEPKKPEEPAGDPKGKPDAEGKTDPEGKTDAEGEPDPGDETEGGEASGEAEDEGPKEPPPIELDERETRSRVDYFSEAEDWVLSSLILLSLGDSWHPAGSEMILEAFDARDPRVRVFALETLARTRPDALPAAVTPELLEHLIKKELKVNHPLYHNRVRDVLARTVPAAEAKKLGEWRKWWRKHGDSYVPPEWTPPPEREAVEGAGETVEIVRRAFDLRRAGLDLAICIDSTGSMQSGIDSARDSITEIVAMLGSLTPRLRVGLVHYRDLPDMEGGAAILSPLTGQAAAVRQALTELAAGGGGDYPERVEKGLELTLSPHMKWNPTANKIVLILGDAPPHPDALPIAVDLAKRAFENPLEMLVGKRRSRVVVTGNPKKAKDVRPFVTASVGLGGSAKAELEAIAKAGGGVYGEIPRTIPGAEPSAEGDEATEAIVRHIMILSFGQRWSRQITEFVDAFYEYRTAGLLK